jgi:tetratricopeptide (TPR) repeat protein
VPWVDPALSGVNFERPHATCGTTVELNSRIVNYMLLRIVTVIVLAAASQSVSDERARAEQLARAGKNTEAIELFRQVVQKDPADTEARLWIARLDLRVGRTSDAEAGFRSVLREHPADIDATIGLANALLRKGAAPEALTILLEVAPAAGQNSDLFGALARAYRRTGDDRRALEYFMRARALSPDDPDVAAGYESVVFAYGHSITFEGFRQWDPDDVHTSSGLFGTSIRVAPRLHLDASAAFSPMFAWDTGRIRFDSRYTYSRVHLGTDSTLQQSDAAAADDSSSDHSVLLRGKWRRWRRVSLQGGYAYGIESFEDFTIDRVTSLGATTVSMGGRFDLSSLTMITTTYEHQWRSNSTTMDRLTIALPQFFR